MGEEKEGVYMDIYINMIWRVIPGSHRIFFIIIFSFRGKSMEIHMIRNGTEPAENDNAREGDQQSAHLATGIDGFWKSGGGLGDAHQHEGLLSWFETGHVDIGQFTYFFFHDPLESDFLRDRAEFFLK